MRDRKLREKAKLQEERKERILKFLQENRESQPVVVPERNTFAKNRKPPRNDFKSATTDLKSCLIATPSVDQRLPAGENNPAARRTGNLPRVDEECQFHSPGRFFLKGRNVNIASQEVYFKPSKPIRKELKNKCDFFPKYVDPSPFKDQITQTLYRESSAQTLAYLPDVENVTESYGLELFTLPSVLPGNKPPGLYEVEILERARKRRRFLEGMKTNFINQRINGRKLAIHQYASLMEALEWEHWVEREEQIQECQMIRLEMVIKMFDKREREMHSASKTRLKQGLELIEKRRKAALRKNEIEYQRGMRRNQKQLARTSIRWQKQKPMYSLGSPCSEFYAPAIRYGVDPGRRNFSPTASFRAFNMRIDELEKQINLKIVECPFSKLNQWSRPKQQILEVENHFLKENNLKQLYNSLKILGTSIEKNKPKPNCLKTRFQPQDTPGGNSRLASATMERFSKLYDRGEEDPKISSQRSSTKEAIRQHLKWHENQISSEHAQKLKKDDSKNDLRNMLVTYEGSLIGHIMQFLNDEMTRLKEQRRLHFFAVLGQKGRWSREAVEAGERQKENAMRQLYEEMFQNSNSVQTDISDQYVHSILTNDLGYMAAEEAAETVTELARQIDVDIERWLESFKLIQNPLTYIPLRLMLQDMVCPDLNATLQRYENTMIAQYIVEDVIFDRIWKDLEPYDISSTLTSDLIDRLIDNDLYFFSSESESETPQRTSWYEAHAIIRKLIRQSVPGRRWKEEVERIVYENYNDLMDDIFAEMIFRRDNLPILEPVVVHSTLSHNDLSAHDKVQSTRGHEFQSSKTTSDTSAGSDIVIKTQILSLKRKKKHSDTGFGKDPPVSVETKPINDDVVSFFDDDDPWPWLPHCQSASSSKKNLY